MPLIREQARRAPKRPLNIRICPQAMGLLDSYCEFINSGRHHVVEHALRYTFSNDPEFQAWLLARGEQVKKSA